MTFGMVVLAGGIGRRIGRPFPKQFLLLGGKPLIIHVLEKAHALTELERVVITCPEAHLDETVQLLRNHRMDSRFSCIVGGATRQESVYRGLMELGGTAYYVLAVIAMINTAVSAYYYLIIAKYMYFDRAEDAAPVASPILGRVIVLGMLILTFYLCFRADVILDTTLNLRMHV